MYHAVAYPPWDEELVMRQAELHLSDKDREVLDSYRTKVGFGE